MTTNHVHVAPEPEGADGTPTPTVAPMVALDGIALLLAPNASRYASGTALFAAGMLEGWLTSRATRPRGSRHSC